MKLYTEEQVINFAISMISQYEFGNKNILNKELLKESLDCITPIELPSDKNIIPVKALEEDYDWYLIPNELYEEFKNDTYNEEMVESGGFDDKWWKYKTGGDLNLIQLYVKIQGGNK